ELSRRLEDSIGDDSELFARSWRADGARLAEGVGNRATSNSVRNVFTALGEANQRRRAFEAAQEVSKWFQDPARGRGERPHIVAVIDETGRVIARDTDRNRMYGDPLLNSVPVLRRVLQRGASKYGVWAYQDKLLQVGVAAVRNDQGGVVGALLVGYDLSNGFAKQEARLIGHDLLFVMGERIYSTSTAVDVRDALQDALYSPPLDNGTLAALQGKPTLPWMTTLSGDEYVGITAALPMARGVEAAYVILADHAKHTALAGVANMILWLTLLGIAGVAIYGYIIANSLMDPIEQMEDDILAVINGRGDVRLDVDTPELGGLSYRVNQMINLFTGVAEEDEEGRAVTSSGGWESVSASNSGSASGPSAPSPVTADDPEASALAAVPEGQYYAQLYKDYVAAKQAVGEDVSSISETRFIERIKGNAAHLIKKHEAQMVRFKVETIGNQVNLKPVVIY
ncbi:MAG: MXAN_5187 C-terminal domain-containing protein, partial [Polyangiales bacterium]